ncbi:DCC1-like thiol-disulfide oxidoreductase family protein [Rothia dentocariosa]|uniref:thiol-disulfide oxidoreductase DCC family protein n=1 Tax=Rothia dentocariosa TaxID=2047 RepID=UPI0028E9A57A|nr:DCC1-like thiol-disulfide oxidoreductase family protein [Rothia dentocariosa]
MSVLLYDPDCGFCTASANLLRRLEPGARILPGTPENLVQYRVDARRFAHALPFINDAGQIIYGSDAIALTLRTCPDATLHGKFLRAAGVLLLNPPMRPAAHRVYRVVAGHRAQISRLTSHLGAYLFVRGKTGLIAEHIRSVLIIF